MRPIDADAYAADLWKLRANYQMLDDTHTADKIMHGIFRAEQVLKEQPTITSSPWHRVEDGLPDDGEWAIFTNGKVVTVERFKLDAYNHFYPASQWFDFEDAIAWMPLPEPPKEDADGNK